MRREILLCRCEDVTDRDARLAIERGAASARDLKLRSRIGMGACQGRICQGTISDLLPERRDDLFSTRPPVRPVLFGDLLGGDEA